MINLPTDGPGPGFNRDPVHRCDAIIPRIGPSSAQHGLAVLRRFERVGADAATSAIFIERSRDKLIALEEPATGGPSVRRRGPQNQLAKEASLVL